MRVELVQSQKQTLSQNMIQSVEILRLSSMELADYIKEQSMENPVMDLDEHMPENKQEERLKKLEWMSRTVHIIGMIRKMKTKTTI